MAPDVWVLDVLAFVAVTEFALVFSFTGAAAAGRPIEVLLAVRPTGAGGCVGAEEPEVALAVPLTVTPCLHFN